jgi:hypothetical protein
MEAKLSLILAVGATGLLMACSTAPAEQARSPRAAKELADALAGRVAGPPQRCISNFPQVEVMVIEYWSFL